MKKLVQWTAILLMAVIMAGAPALAQDELVTCDSDLIVQLYIAEYYFNFGGLRMQLMDMGVYFNFAPFSDLMEVDLEQFDKGQYAPLFDQLATMQNDDRMDVALQTDLMEMLPMTGEEITDMMGAEMPTDTLMLTTDMDEDEPEECQVLRMELNHFYEIIALRDF